VDLLPSPEQIEIVDVVAGFLADTFPTDTLRERATAEASFDAATWIACGELGWFALGLPEELGGVGYGMVEEALVFRELGRHLAPGPFVATALGARLAAVAGESVLASEIAAGTAPVALAAPRNGRPEAGGSITGSFHVIDGPGAAHYLVLTGDAGALIAAGDGGSLVPMPSIDEGARVARLDLDGATPLASIGADDAAELWLRGTVLVSAMLTGIAAATRDLAADYAKVRVQFGKPIGVNQAIKHACADMALRAEAAESQAVFAALSIDEHRADRAFQVASARVIATDAAIANASANVQVHGGMGYTYEHDANLYVKRARILDRMLGSRRSHLADLLRASPAQ
jgi:alkylation response protein AidB-like acyl-CoA dehydrogenase